MCSNLMETDVKVDVVRLNSEAVDEYLLTSTAILRNVLKGDDRNAVASHRCQHCGKLYKTASTLHVHYMFKHPPNDVEVRCVSCDKVYPSIMSLQKHVRYMHRYVHRCHVCYRAFETPELLVQHGEHCFRAEAPCSECGKTFFSNLALRNHFKYKHPQEKVNWCGICRRSFTSSRGLDNHVAMLHPKNIACGRCKKSFNSLMALQSHVLYVHDNSTRCDQCRKVFASRSSLSRHTAKNHDGSMLDEKHTCGICQKIFKNANNLMDHIMNRHTE